MPVNPGGNTNTVGEASPVIQNVSWDRQGALPSLTNLFIQSVNAEYVDYYIQFENTSVEWLELVGYPTNGGYLTDFHISASVPLQLKNLDQLIGSNYKATIQLRLVKAEGADLLLSSVVNLSLSGSADGAVKTEKSNYNVIYNRATDVISGDTIVNVLNTTDEVSFETIGSLFLEKTAALSFTLEQDPLFLFQTNQELPQEGAVTVSCRLKKAGVYVYSFTITLIVIVSEDITVNPTSFEFTLRKGLNETQSAQMTLVNPLNKAYTITCPDWLILSQTSGSSSVEISLTTLNSEVLDVSNYSAEVIISFDSKSLLIPVKLKVLAFQLINISKYNFCLDNIILQINQFYDTAKFVRISVDMLISSDEGLQTFTAVYIIPYFKNQATIDIGEKIQNYYPIFNESLFEWIGGFNNQLIYKPINTQIKVEEIDINYQVLYSQTVNNVAFFAGHKPALFPLFTNYGLRRKYAESIHIFSYFTGLISSDDFNGLPTSDNPVGDFEVQAVVLQESEVSYPELKSRMNLDFLTFPDVEKKIVLQWLNNNLVPEWFIFSGDYKITTEFEHSYDNVMINGRKYDTKDLSKVTITTGFILKEEKNLIKEIIRSLSSFIRIESEVFNCFSITQKLIEKDSTEDLLNYELEFLIVK